RATARCADIWSLGMQDALPIVPVPLRPPDGDIPLDLATAFTTIYDRAAYDLSVNYEALPPPPPLAAAEHTWIGSEWRGEHDKLRRVRHEARVVLCYDTV